MQLILWRHAEAEDPGGKRDIDRELTNKGRRQAQKMAAWLGTRIDKDWRILVSPARRTLETVDPLDLSYEEADAVGLAATAATLLNAAEWPDADRNVLVVGHQPTLGEAVARLLGTDEGQSVRKGAIWWFVARERDGKVETLLKLVLSPEELGPDA